MARVGMFIPFNNCHHYTLVEECTTTKTIDPFEIFSKFHVFDGILCWINIPSKNPDSQNVLANTTRRKTTSI
jgi:hypothetical protein